MNAQRALTAVSSAFLLLAFAGCSAPSETEPESEQTQSPTAAQPTQSEETAHTQAPVPTETRIAGPLDASAAVGRAMELAPGAVVELGMGRERGVEVWEVGVLREDSTGVELYVDRQTADLVRESSLQLSSEQRTPPAVVALEAIGAALVTVPGSVTELDLDTERGVVVWEVMVDADAGGRFELYIDATTTQILKQERAD